MALDVTALVGNFFSGKTTRLIEAVRETLEGGVEPADMLLCAASPVAAQELSRRLAAEELPVAAVVPRAHLMSLLSDEEAQAVTHRRPRLLLPFEYSFFLEDLKTTGLKAHRLREMLKFFYRGLAEGESIREDWLITNEEREVMALINDTLAFEGALLEAEVAPLALRALDEAPTLGQRSMVPCVFVDDYPLLSRATQQALVRLAGERLVVTGNTDGGPEVYEAYPNRDGMSELVEAFPDARVIEVSAGRSSAALAEEDVFAEDSMADEMAVVARVVGETLDEGISAEEIVVATDHPAWRRGVSRGLRAQGIAAAETPSLGFLRCDVRYDEGSTAARLVTLLALAADPSDGVAWRAWCGFGDYLANSNGFRSLCQRSHGRTFAAMVENGQLQPDLLDGLDAMGSIRRIEVAYQVGKAILNRVAGLEGKSLLEAIMRELGHEEAPLPPALLALVLPGNGDEGAEAMIGQLRAAAAFPVFPATNDVRVASFKETHGLAPKLLVIAGAMNGLFPKADFFDGTMLTIEQRNRRAEADRQLATSLKARASERLVVTETLRLPLEDAERLGVVIERIALSQGQRMAKTEPSWYVLGEPDDVTGALEYR